MVIYSQRKGGTDVQVKDQRGYKRSVNIKTSGLYILSALKQKSASHFTGFIYIANKTKNSFKANKNKRSETKKER